MGRYEIARAPGWIPTSTYFPRTRSPGRYPVRREDGRADEGDGLENRWWGDSPVGSNPTPPALGDVVSSSWRCISISKLMRVAYQRVSPRWGTSAVRASGGASAADG